MGFVFVAWASILLDSVFLVSQVFSHRARVVSEVPNGINEGLARGVHPEFPVS